jgi:hypothetical protein
VQLDVDTEDVMLIGGMYEEDGWLDMEGQGGHNIVAIRYEDGSYDVLYNEPINDGMNFFGYHESYEEAIYDWYVSGNSLDLPLYVEDWGDKATLSEYSVDVPVHRYDGDGWYIYVPISGWEQVEVSDPNQWAWSSAYYTDAFLLVDRFSTSVADQYAISAKEGFTPLDGTGNESSVWVSGSSSDRGQELYYFKDAPDGGSYRITISWYDTGSDNPYITMEPAELRLMAESFTVNAQKEQVYPGQMSWIHLYQWVTLKAYRAYTGSG